MKLKIGQLAKKYKNHFFSSFPHFTVGVGIASESVIKIKNGNIHFKVPELITSFFLISKKKVVPAVLAVSVSRHGARLQG